MNGCLLNCKDRNFTDAWIIQISARLSSNTVTTNNVMHDKQNIPGCKNIEEFDDRRDLNHIRACQPHE